MLSNLQPSNPMELVPSGFTLQTPHWKHPPVLAFGGPAGIACGHAAHLAYGRVRFFFSGTVQKNENRLSPASRWRFCKAPFFPAHFFTGEHIV